MPETVFFTIVSASYLNQALTTVESVKKHHIDFDFFIFIVDLKEEYISQKFNIQVTSTHVLIEKFPEIIKFNSYYNVLETICALKPFVTKFLLDKYERIIYSDADTFFFNPIDIKAEQLEMGGFTPHRINSSPINNRFGDLFDMSLIKFGFFNLGFFIILKKDSEFLTWWTGKLVFDCLYSPELFLFVDQKWIDLGIHYFDLNSIKDESLNIGPWNLDQRPITRKNEAYFVCGKKITMIHFSGVTNSNPDKHVEDFYPRDLSRPKSLNESITNYTELSHFWLTQQTLVYQNYNKLIKSVASLKKVVFDNRNFFDRNKRIKDLKQGKPTKQSVNPLGRKLKKIIAKFDKNMSKIETYKFGRAYLNSDIRKIAALFSRRKP